ncbi:MAG: hypothetical protein HZB33_06585 [Nitrospirae bacterium]|nr:hypothetical protein [Nitrospirota bacterium]
MQDSNTDQKDLIELEIKKQTYESSYHDYMIINCYLMMYAHFEECLAVAFRLFPKGEYVTNGAGLNRFNEAFLNKYSIRITEAPSWPFLNDCSQLRNVLLHAAGNITLVRDKKKIDTIISRHSNLVRLSSSRINLEGQILNEFSKALSEFVEWVGSKIEMQQNSLKKDEGKQSG